jgi:hypothetical protein
MKKTALTVILYAIAISLTLISIAPYNRFKLLSMIVLISIAAGLLLSMTLVIWYEGTFKERLKQAMSAGFPLAALFFIAGYVYIIIESLIRK